MCCAACGCEVAVSDVQGGGTCLRKDSSKANAWALIAAPCSLAANTHCTEFWPQQCLQLVVQCQCFVPVPLDLCTVC